jgi:hypothetical protein
LYSSNRIFEQQLYDHDMQHPDQRPYAGCQLYSSDCVVGKSLCRNYLHIEYNRSDAGCHLLGGFRFIG